MKTAATVCVALLLFGFAGVAHGQNEISLRTLDVRSAPGSDVQMVLSVLDEQGRPVKGLGKANFRLSVEGKEIKEFLLEPVSGAKNPLSVILEMDVSGSMKGVPIAEAKKAASEFLDQLDKEDFTALMAFGSSTGFLTDFTRNRHVLREKIGSLKAVDMYTWLYQTTFEGIEKATTAPTSRVAIVILTDGKDEGSPIREEDVLARIKGTQTPIYALGLGPKVQMEYLKRISSVSGGSFFHTPNAEDINKLYGMVLDNLRNQYLLQFNFPKPAGDYSISLTLNYRGREVSDKRTFLHTVVEKSISPQRDWLKIAPIFGALIIIGVVSAYFLRRAKPTSARPPDEKEAPEVSMMVRKNIHPVGLSSGFTPKDTIVLKPASGEVGLEVNVDPLPVPFALIDKKHRKELHEVIITRYDEKRDHFFSQEKVYLLFSDSSISRPDEQKEGHARVFMDADTGGYRIDDLGSIAGTKLNNNNLSPNESLSLVDGDVITIGRTSMKYYDRRPRGETTF